jgi:hypothetical protein
MANKHKKPTNPKGINGTQKLTEKMLHYCRCRANNMNMSDSYRESYSASNMSKKTINEAASRLDGNSMVSARVNLLISQKEQALVRSSVSLRQKVLTKLESFMDSATTADTAKIRAAELLGKSIGLFKDVIEDGTKTERSVEELTASLESKLASLEKPLH